MDGGVASGAVGSRAMRVAAGSVAGMVVGRGCAAAVEVVSAISNGRYRRMLRGLWILGRTEEFESALQTVAVKQLVAASVVEG